MARFQAPIKRKKKKNTHHKITFIQRDLRTISVENPMCLDCILRFWWKLYFEIILTIHLSILSPCQNSGAGLPAEQILDNLKWWILVHIGYLSLFLPPSVRSTFVVPLVPWRGEDICGPTKWSHLFFFFFFYCWFILSYFIVSQKHRLSPSIFVSSTCLLPA